MHPWSWWGFPGFTSISDSVWKPAGICLTMQRWNPSTPPSWPLSASEERWRYEMQLLYKLNYCFPPTQLIYSVIYPSDENLRLCHRQVYGLLLWEGKNLFPVRIFFSVCNWFNSIYVLIWCADTQCLYAVLQASGAGGRKRKRFQFWCLSWPTRGSQLFIFPIKF